MVRRRAFTLVELLVVIGIIATLIALLLPVMGKAREAARAGVCASNLRQCGLGLQMYANAFGQSVPVRRVKNGGWVGWPQFMCFGKTMFDDDGQPVWVPRKVTLCPSNFYSRDDMSTINSAGYAMFTVSTGSSGTLPVFFNSDFERSFFKTVGTDNYEARVQKLTRLPTQPSRTVWMADSLANGPSSTGGGGHMFSYFVDQSRSLHDAAIHVLHGANSKNGVGAGRANVLFYDGHVELLTDRDIRNGTDSRVRYYYGRTGSYYALP